MLVAVTLTATEVFLGSQYIVPGVNTSLRSELLTAITALIFLLATVFALSPEVEVLIDPAYIHCALNAFHIFPRVDSAEATHSLKH